MESEVAGVSPPQASVLQGLQWLQLFENESLNTYAQAAETIDVCWGRVWQLVSLVTRLPREVTDFLVADKDPLSAPISANEDSGP